MKRQFVVCAILLFGAVVAASAAAAPAADHVLLTPAELHWMPAPAVLPKGAKIAVLSGNPFAEGFFTVRLWLPAGYAIPPHWHPTAENVTVLKGTLYVGMGDKLDKSAAKPVPALGFASLPALNHHYVYTTEITVVDLTAYGPFQITYVNPADDPSRQAATSQ